MAMKFDLKPLLWTELEVSAIVAGAVAANQLADETKIFKKDFEQHPDWFKADRKDAPWHIKFFPGMKALAAVYVATNMVKNPWIKLLLYGVAFQGTLQQVRIFTWDAEKGEGMVKEIGQASTAAELDRKLREIAEGDRMSGPEEDQPNIVNQYSTGVAGPQIYDEAEMLMRPSGPAWDKYPSAVAGFYDDSGNVFTA